jgi:DNA-directed RNA polymerase specialized sigma24 family protein
MSKNTHLYTDFAKMVHFYNRKLGEEDGALWELLVNLANNNKALSNRYVAVSLRNEYIKLSKAKQKYAEITTAYCEIHGATNPDIDLLLDIKAALTRLSDKERKAVLMRYFWGFSTAEIAVLNGVSRQAENKRLKIALDKLKIIL